MLEERFENMNLPLVNEKEDLETISNNVFRPHFDVNKFEIRSENYRDKGIDFHIEIKKSKSSGASVFTNFRFAVQLKATEVLVENTDGSYSLPVSTSNINYLLNNSMPAYYVLYHKPSGKFYYENVNTLYGNLTANNSQWDKQEKNSIRFSHILDSEAIEKIYNEVWEKGKFQRQITERSAAFALSAKPDDKILIDSKFNIIDDETIRKTIQAVGLDLVNEIKWKDVITYHKKASGNVASTALYNLIIGLAHYYNGDIYDSLKYLKDSYNLKEELSSSLLNHLIYFYATVRYILGISSKDEYQSNMNTLESTGEIGLYIKLENAKARYIDSLREDDAFTVYQNTIQEILDSPEAGDYLKINAKRELLLHEGFNNNMEYTKTISKINAVEAATFPDPQMRKEYLTQFIAIHRDWSIKVAELLNISAEKKDHFSYYNTLITEIKVNYELAVQIKLLMDAENKATSEIDNETKLQLESYLKKVNDATDYFNTVGHIENKIAALSLEYEILHFIQKFEEAEKCLATLGEIISVYDSKSHKKRFEYLKSQGTSHEQLKHFLDASFEKAEEARKRWLINREDMIRMDDEELSTQISFENSYQIHLFPIGYFRFPKAEVKKVFEILNVVEDAQQIYLQMFEFCIPNANIHNVPILAEGLSNGMLDDKGPISWDNIYRVRKAFYENKFYRFNIR